MALANGVLVHGPTAWACAIRTDEGEIKVAAARKRLLAPGITQPFVRGPLRLAESFAMLPELRRRLPEARLPFERPSVLALTAARRSPSRSCAAHRGSAAPPVSSSPARSRSRPRCSPSAAASWRPITEPSTSRSAPTSTARSAAKEHERCGSHLVGPLLAASAAANVLAARAPAQMRSTARVAGSVAAVGTAVEVFAWMTRHPGHPLARALAKPGHALQHRVATAEPTPEQLEVAEAALAACLELENGDQAAD